MTDTKSIYELSDEFKISVRKLNAMAKAGHLRFNDGKREPIAQMRYYLKKGRMLTVEQLLDLARNPDKAAMLDNAAPAARKQIKSLGNIANDHLGAGFSYSLIYGAFIADKESLDTLTQWLRRIVPPEGCGYHYVAVRMLWSVPEPKFKEAYAFLARAIVNLRRHAGITGKDKHGMRFGGFTLDL